MSTSAPLFLAFRYLRPKRSFVSVITLISVLGIAVGVLMMIMVRAVMQGFEVEFRDTLIAEEPHVVFEAEAERAKADPPDAWQALTATARARPGVLSAAPFAGGVIYVEHEDYQTAVQLFGLDPAEAGPRIEKLRPRLRAGSLELAEDTLVVSDMTADALGLRIGDEVRVYPSDAVIDIAHQYRGALNERDETRKNETLKKIRLDPVRLKIAGVVGSSLDGKLGYASLPTGRKVFGLGAGVSGVVVELAEPGAAKEFAAGLKNQVPPGWQTRLWVDAGDARLAAMKNEQIMMQLVLLIIAAVAAFSVMNTTITVTTQKRREIGVLAAVGARPGMVVGVFVIQAAVVGVLGTALGLAGSFLVLHFRNHIRALISWIGGGEIHAVDGVFLSTIPAHVQPGDVMTTCVLSIALCLIAAVLPAYFAARLDPAAALRD